MSTKFESDDKGSPDLLERAVTALRSAPIPVGPSPEIQSRTLSALSGGASHQGRGLWKSGQTHRLAWAAVLACVAAGAAATYFAVVRHPGDESRRQVTDRGSNNSDLRNIATTTDPSMVTGEIRFEGNAPPPRLIDFGSSAGCAERHNQPMYDDSLLVNLDDTLQNVVVSVVAGLPDKTYPEPRTPVYLDQAGCSFQPHVLAMQTGQPIVLRNSDPVLHDTHSLSIRNPRFNVVQPRPDTGRAIPSPRVPEIFQVQCDIHPWMKSWFCAFNHPYFDVSRANGTFTLYSLPPGHYRLRAWHERLGTQERDVVVKPGRDETINFVFHLSSTPTSPQAAAQDSSGAGHT